MRRWSGTFLLCGTLLLLFAGCSLPGGGGSGGSSLSLGFAGSTADKPSKPPTLAQGGPGGTYAFVYDDQIWLRAPGKDLTQLTHLVLSSGANIAWGPIVWSASGRYIAFALVQSLNPASPSGSSGPIYIVDTTNGDLSISGGTGSIYGHTYDWYGDHMLFYSAGGAIDMFGPFGDCSTCDPRTWTVRTPVQGQVGSYSGQSVAYGDVAISGGNLYFTHITLTSLGGSGTVGSAVIQQIQLGIASDDTSPYDDVSAFPVQGYAPQVADLGQAYAGPQGGVSTGAWDLTGQSIIAQHIDRVDTKAGQVYSSFCAYDAYGNCTAIFRDAGKAPLSAAPGLTIGGDHVAYTNGTLYFAKTDGSQEAKLANAGWTMPPAVSSDGKTAAATQLASQSTSASGLIHDDTNILTFEGSNSLNFIPGGQDFSWKP